MDPHLVSFSLRVTFLSEVVKELPSSSCGDRGFVTAWASRLPPPYPIST